MRDLLATTEQHMSTASRTPIARRPWDHPTRARALLIVIAALALAAAVIVLTPAPSDARHRDRDTSAPAAAAPAPESMPTIVKNEGPADTVAVVDYQGQFGVLSSVSSEAAVGSFWFGNPADEPLMGDWNCDGEQTPGTYRRSTGSVYLRDSNSQGVADRTFYFGSPGDVPLVGDFDGDGCDTLAIYRPSEARFYLSNRLGGVVAERVFYFGDYGDSPIAGDWNGDGVDTIGVFRPNTGLVALRDGNSAGTPDRVFTFGDPNDRVIAGDWDGDGDDTVAVYRPSNGILYISNANRTGVADTWIEVGRGQRVVPASGIDPASVPQMTYVPPPPATPAPASGGTSGGNSGGSTTPPPPATEVGPVPGFDAPPSRAASGPIRISGDSDVVIENLHISNPGGICVEVFGGANVTVRNSTIGPCGDEAVYMSDVTNVTVTGNYITGTGNGVLIHRSNSVRVDNNAFVNAGRNFVQFDKVNGAGSSISGNRGQNALGGSNAEDMISLFASSGTASSPIRIAGNHLRNGGPSGSGSGIMLGDGQGTNQIVEGNVLVNPGQVGIGVASGSGIIVRNNRIYSDPVAWSNVGLYVWDQYGGCGSVEITGNQVNWTAAGGYSNGFYNGGGCDANIHDNDWNAPIGPGIF